MARCSVIVLGLLMSVGLLGSAGCKEDQAPTTAQGPGEPEPLADPRLVFWQNDVEQYRLHTKDPESLRPQAEEFMRAVQLNMLTPPKGPRREKTTEMGTMLFEQGCQDPMLRMYLGQATADDKGGYRAMWVIADALNTWMPEYPEECRRVGLYALFGQSKTYHRAMPWPQIREEVAHLAALRVGDPAIDPEMRRLVYRELLPLITTSADTWEDAVAIYEACSQAPNADPWILHMLAGHAYRARAVHHRGEDWASTVTPEGWRLCTENLDKAAREYAEAIKLHPENPEAACQMIGVAMIGGSHGSPSEWFDRAVAADASYMPSYDSLLLALWPRWGGSHEAMYRFGCRCADTRRYDTEVPFVLVAALSAIDEERGFDREIWRREGAYARVKEAVEGMANDPSRADDAGALLGRSGMKTILVALATRAGELEDARRLVDELGERFDDATFPRWCNDSEQTLTRIYAHTGNVAADVEKAEKTLVDAPRPFSEKTLRNVRGLYEKSLAAADDERTKALCRCWVSELDGRLGYDAGEWFEKRFDPNLLCWSMVNGRWSREDERTAIGRPHVGSARVLMQPDVRPLCPLEIEFDIEAVNPPDYPIDLGLFIPGGKQGPASEIEFHRFFVRTRENLAGIEIGGKKETVACDLKPVNHLRVELADGRAALYVNGTFCLDRNDESFRPMAAYNLGSHTPIYEDMAVRVSNVRLREWTPPTKEGAAMATARGEHP